MLEKLKNNIVLTFWVIFCFSVLFFLTKSLYQQKKVDDYLVEFKEKNQGIVEKNISQLNNLKFFESKFYKEIYAKENLNLLNEWEKVIIIEKSFLDDNFFLKNFLTEKSFSDENFTNFQKWEKFFNLN